MSHADPAAPADPPTPAPAGDASNLPSTTDGAPVTDRSTAMHDGDVAGLTAFLDWLIDTGQPCGLTRGTLIQIRSSWRVVTRELNLPAGQRYDMLSPEVLMQRFSTARGRTLVSVATYLTRLRRAIQLYRTWLDSEPDRHTTGRGRPPHPTATHLVTFPLRPGLDITIQLPPDLRRAEAALLATWLASRATS